MSNRRPEHVPEEFLGQILVRNAEGVDEWVDYSRGTEDAARRWQAEKPDTRRVVDWIYKERIIFGPGAPEPLSRGTVTASPDTEEHP